MKTAILSALALVAGARPQSGFSQWGQQPNNWQAPSWFGPSPQQKPYNPQGSGWPQRQPSGWGQTFPWQTRGGFASQPSPWSTTPTAPQNPAPSSTPATEIEWGAVFETLAEINFSNARLGNHVKDILDDIQSAMDAEANSRTTAGDVARTLQAAIMEVNNSEVRPDVQAALDAAKAMAPNSPIVSGQGVAPPPETDWVGILEGLAEVKFSNPRLNDQLASILDDVSSAMDAEANSRVSAGQMLSFLQAVSASGSLDAEMSDMVRQAIRGASAIADPNSPVVSGNGFAPAGELPEVDFAELFTMIKEAGVQDSNLSNAVASALSDFDNAADKGVDSKTQTAQALGILRAVLSSGSVDLELRATIRDGIKVLEGGSPNAPVMKAE